MQTSKHILFTIENYKKVYKMLGLTKWYQETPGRTTTEPFKRFLKDEKVSYVKDNKAKVLSHKIKILTVKVNYRQIPL